MICYVLAMGKQHLGAHVVAGYGIKIFWPSLIITSPDHLEALRILIINTSEIPGFFLLLKNHIIITCIEDTVLSFTCEDVSPWLLKRSPLLWLHNPLKST